jgi:hypothetical protein
VRERGDEAVKIAVRPSQAGSGIVRKPGYDIEVDFACKIA